MLITRTELGLLKVYFYSSLKCFIFIIVILFDHLVDYNN